MVMRYYKQVADGYILSIGVGGSGTEITEAEYNEIKSVIHNKPQGTDTYDYQLKENLTWEMYGIEPVVPDADAEELLNILTGESND